MRIVAAPLQKRVRWAAAVSAFFAADPDAHVLPLDDNVLNHPHLQPAERVLAVAVLD